jgi:hypothetical protein|tara:strand:- start:392 stop:610 length:219 start_codon:yes stop_codon:yes gene_type:complete
MDLEQMVDLVVLEVEDNFRVAVDQEQHVKVTMVEMVILIQMDQTLAVEAVEQVVQEDLLLPQVELVELVEMV